MAKTSGGIRPIRKVVDYDEKSREIGKQTLEKAEVLKGNPMKFHISNTIEMDVEITKADIKTIVGKRTQDAKFNAIKNKLAQDIKGYIQKAKYVGWRETEPNKHFESAYFVYYNRSLGANTYLTLRKMKGTGKFKPYAIINEAMFNTNKDKIKTKMPPK